MQLKAIFIKQLLTANARGRITMIANTVNYPVHPLISERWSPRAMSGESISHDQLMTIFKAGSLAPSSFNNQPWTFIYANRETPDWEIFFNLLVPFNQEWTKNAAVLVVVVSKNNFYSTGKPSRTHSFDTGAAWENMALQASADNLVAHGMEGFDYDATCTLLSIPDDHTAEMMFALGKPANDLSVLSTELQEKEKRSDRVPLEQVVCKGKFKLLR